MDRKRLFKTLAYLIIFIFLVNFIAVKLYWYYSIWYFDMPMHFLGGLWLGLAIFWFLSRRNSLEISGRMVFKVLLGVLLIGLCWEVFEILVNNSIAQNPFSALDTISDICFDVSGGLCAILYLWKKQLR